MPPRRSLVPRLTDMIEAIERVRGIVGAVSLEAFEEDWQRQWMVQRGVEILSEASRHLTDELKSRHRNIPWTKVAGIGNVLRHGYEKHLGTYPVETRPRRPAVTGEGLSRGTDYGAGARARERGTISRWPRPDPKSPHRIRQSHVLLPFQPRSGLDLRLVSR